MTPRYAILLSSALCIATLLWFPGCNKSSNSPASSGNSSTNTPAAQSPIQSQDDDDKAQSLIANKGVEAREWLNPSHANHAGFKMSPATMLDWTNKFYAAGADKVYCVDMQTIGNSEVCAMFVIQMPNDPAARKAVLKVSDDLNEEDHPSPDNNEKYLIEALD